MYALWTIFDFWFCRDGKSKPTIVETIPHYRGVFHELVLAVHNAMAPLEACVRANQPDVNPEALPISFGEGGNLAEWLKLCNKILQKRPAHPAMPHLAKLQSVMLSSDAHLFFASFRHEQTGLFSESPLMKETGVLKSQLEFIKFMLNCSAGDVMKVAFLNVCCGHRYPTSGKVFTILYSGFIS